MTNNDKYYDDLVGQLGLFKKKEQASKPQQVVQQKETRSPKQTIIARTQVQIEDDDEIESLKDKPVSEECRAAKFILRTCNDGIVLLKIMIRPDSEKYFRQDWERLYHYVMAIDAKKKLLSNRIQSEMHTDFNNLLKACGRLIDQFTSNWSILLESFGGIRLIMKDYLKTLR